MYCYSRDHATINNAFITIRNNDDNPTNIWVYIKATGPNYTGPYYFQVKPHDNEFIRDATLGQYYFEIYDANWERLAQRSIQVVENSNIYLYIKRGLTKIQDRRKWHPGGISMM